MARRYDEELYNGVLEDKLYEAAAPNYAHLLYSAWALNNTSRKMVESGVVGAVGANCGEQT